jgi:hypothetical protein
LLPLAALGLASLRCATNDSPSSASNDSGVDGKHRMAM